MCKVNSVNYMLSLLSILYEVALGYLRKTQN